jgi:dTDP-4-dehydrorhamnose 3,5-epimerase
MIDINNPKKIIDERGYFIKIFQGNFSLKEEYFSSSKKNVLRGMHFQLPPYAVNKIVYCIQGEVLDVILDLRKNSKTYKQYFTNILSKKNNNILFVPKGFAHGFLSLKNNSILIYKTDNIYHPKFDVGISWDSFGFKWPIKKPLISERDQNFSSLKNFKSPF